MAEAASNSKAYLASEDPTGEDGEMTSGRVRLKGRLSLGHPSQDVSASMLTAFAVKWYRSTLYNALILGVCNFLAPGIWGGNSKAPEEHLPSERLTSGCCSNELARRRWSSEALLGQRRECSHILSDGGLLQLQQRHRSLYRHQVGPDIRNNGLCPVRRRLVHQQSFWHRVVCSLWRCSLWHLSRRFLDGRGRHCAFLSRTVQSRPIFGILVKLPRWRPDFRRCLYSNENPLQIQQLSMHFPSGDQSGCQRPKQSSREGFIQSLSGLYSFTSPGSARGSAGQQAIPGSTQGRSSSRLEHRERKFKRIAADRQTLFP